MFENAVVKQNSTKKTSQTKIRKNFLGNSGYCILGYGTVGYITLGYGIGAYFRFSTVNPGKQRQACLRAIAS